MVHRYIRFSQLRFVHRFVRTNQSAACGLLGLCLPLCLAVLSRSEQVKGQHVVI